MSRDTNTALHARHQNAAIIVVMSIRHIGAFQINAYVREFHIYTAV